MSGNRKHTGPTNIRNKPGSICFPFTQVAIHACEYILFLKIFFQRKKELRQGLTLQPYLAWNSLCSSGWPYTGSDPPASAFQYQGYNKQTTTLGLNILFKILVSTFQGKQKLIMYIKIYNYCFYHKFTFQCFTQQSKRPMGKMKSKYRNDFKGNHFIVLVH